MDSRSLLLLSAFLLGLVLVYSSYIDDGASLQQSMFQARAPQDISRPASEAALKRFDVGKEMEEPLQEAVAATRVDAHNYGQVAATLGEALSPWSGQHFVAAPEGRDALVAAWPPVEEGEFGVPVPRALLVPGSKAEEMQPVPAQVDRSNPASKHCCALLDRINFRSNLPVVVVNTGGRVVIPVRSNVPAHMCTCGAAVAANSDGIAEDYEGYMNVKVRGSSSAVQNVKKQLGIKLRWAEDDEDNREGRRLMAEDDLDDDDEDEDHEADGSFSSLPKLGKKRKASLMGMPAGSHFVLWSGDGDTTLGMRNALAYDTARATGNWAPRVQFCELFVIQDGQPLSIDHYAGNTLLLERIKRGKHRVDVQKLRPDEDLSGGYIWGYERNLWDDLRFSPTPLRGDGRGLTYLINYPKMKQAVKEQQQGKLGGTALRIVKWASSYMASAEVALVKDQPPKGAANVPESGSWRALVNETAMIDYLLVTEITKNPDGFRGSIYMSKDKGKPLHIGPVWDYNEAFGMCCGYPITGYQNQGKSNGTSGGSAISPEGFRFNICDEPQRCLEDPVDGISLWFRAAWNREPAFRASVARRWKELRSSKLSDEWFKSRLRAYVQDLAFASPRNAIRWSAVLESPHYESPYHLYQWSVRTMGKWLMPHLAWLDAAFNQAHKEAEATPGAVGGQAGWEQRVMEAAVVEANADAKSSAASEAWTLEGLPPAMLGGPTQVSAISERLALLRRAIG